MNKWKQAENPEDETKSLLKNKHKQPLQRQTIPSLISNKKNWCLGENNKHAKGSSFTKLSVVSGWWVSQTFSSSSEINLLRLCSRILLFLLSLRSFSEKKFQKKIVAKRSASNYSFKKLSKKDEILKNEIFQHDCEMWSLEFRSLEMTMGGSMKMTGLNCFFVFSVVRRKLELFREMFIQICRLLFH